MDNHPEPEEFQPREPRIRLLNLSGTRYAALVLVYGVGRRLAHRQQRANLTKQVITDPGQQSFSGPIQICRALLGAFIRQEAASFLRKRDRIAVNWDSVPLGTEDAGVLPLAASLDLLFIVKTRLSARIKKNQFAAPLNWPRRHRA